ncbi:MAG: hypothetical protein EOP38_00405 [Rubrivivax sp.]|nr:MAG: hypothetical protein EOP38_00405 [Rubrivivax sp.]
MRPQINLIDPTLLPKVERFSGKTVMLIAGVSLAVVAVHHAHERVQLNQTLALARAQEASNAALPPTDTPPVDAALEARKQALARDESLRDGLAKLTDLPTDNAAILSNVIAALPRSLWLKEVDFVAKGGLRIVGGAVEPTALAEYSDALARVPALHGLPIEVVSLEAPPPRTDGEDGPVQYHHFVLATANAQGTTP